jgi:transcriptional regulator with XRE-family HTH domain
VASTDPEHLIRDVGRRVAELRRDAGWTQAELAATADVSLKYIQRIEAGDANLTLRSLAKIANTFSVSVPALLEKPSSRQAGPGRPPR